MQRVRLDSLLAERGLFESRSRAAAAVLAGAVHLGPGRRRAEKPGQLVDPAVELSVSGRAAVRVARGREAGQRAGCPSRRSLRGRPASMSAHRRAGSRTACCSGAPRQVIALDVAYGELHWRLREDPRVVVMERVNARSIPHLPFAPSLVAIDVSFISLRTVLPSVLACAAREFDCLAMVKPQFEVGREGVSRGGVVRDARLRRSARGRRGAAAASTSAPSVCGFAPSGLPGPAGNRETFVWLAEGGRPGAVADVAAAVEEVDA